MNDRLDSLTAAQREAVEHIDGPLLILAGPGSGKTRVVTHRIANLLQHGVPARSILALTFTNKAAGEMRHRVAKLAPGEPVWTSTFHRFCARLLRQYAAHVGLSENYTIFDTSDSKQALKRTLNELDVETDFNPPERIAAGISWAKNNLMTPEQYEPRPGNPLGAIVAKVYPHYQRSLVSSNAVDFDDLLLHVATLLRESPDLRAELDRRYRYVLVDEYQDTNLAQYTIVRALSIDYPNLAVTGDPDQSIYGWRGANVKNILDFEHDYPAVRVVKLEQNYRSTKSILRVADALIAHNVRRKAKGLFTDNDEGRPVQLVTYPTQLEEAQAIASRIAADVRSGRRRPRDFAIFYRTNALSRSLEFAMREQGVPYQMINGLEFYQRAEIKDVLAYLQLINNPRNDVALQRIINMPARKIGGTSLKRLMLHASRHRLSLLAAAREAGLAEGLGKAAAVAIARFVAMFDRLSLTAAAPVEEILGTVLSESGYHEMLVNSESEEDQDRLANIEELLTAARQFDEQHPGDGHLEEFLEDASLVNDTDAWADADDRATLMTLHASKGLEFPVVFIVAVEEGILPHERSRDNIEQLEEERRLLFVGMTRAREELALSRAAYRDFRGMRRPAIPSMFLMELPRDQMELIGSKWMQSASLYDNPGVAPPDDHAHESHDAFDGVDAEPVEQSVNEDGTQLRDADSVAGMGSDADSVADETHALDEDAMSFDFGASAKASPPAAGQRADVGSAVRTETSRLVSEVRTADPTRAELLTPGAPAARLPTAAPAARLTTAAQLEGAPPSDAAPAFSPEVFRQDMLVTHPEYGLGKIVSLSGSGPRRQATVSFVAGAGSKKFFLLKSMLRPAK